MSDQPPDGVSQITFIGVTFTNVNKNLVCVFPALTEYTFILYFYTVNPSYRPLLLIFQKKRISTNATHY